MIVYLDESYDSAHQFFLLGALFAPSPRRLHRQFRQVKLAEGYVLQSGEVKEVKYSGIYTPRQLRVAKAGVELFKASDSWFRCVVVDQRPESGWSLDFFGSPSDSRAIKEARFYKKFTEMLLRRSSANVTNGVLLTDRMTRCAGDDFIRLIADEFGASSQSGEAPCFRAVQEVDTAEERYQLGQIGDLLMGAVLNELVEPTGARARYKRQFKDYVKGQLEVPSLGANFWAMPGHEADLKHPKFQIWHWRPSRSR